MKGRVTRPYIIAAFPIKSVEDVDKALNVIDIEGVDLVELRVDYLDNPLAVDYHSLKDKRVLVTLREVSEGGAREHPSEIKIKLLKTLEDLGILYDVEIEFAEKHRLNCENAIASIHIMEPSYINIMSLREKVKRFLKSSYIVKIASMIFPGYRALFASLLELGDNVAVMPMSKDPSLATTIMMDRIAFTIMGSKLFYCSVETQTAPGQPRCSDTVPILRRIFNLTVPLDLKSLGEKP